MSEPKQEVCDRAAIVVARMVGWVPEEKRGELAAHIRIALDTEVEAGGPYINNGWNRRALSPPEPTEGLRATLKPFAAEAEKLAEYFQDHAPDGERKVFRGSTLTFQNFRDAAAALRAMPLQDHGWQPINTAPKDGSVIQLFVPDDDDGDVVWPAHWTLPAAKNHLGAWKHCTAGRWVAEDSDQRWRPLAAPPMVAEEGTKS